MIEFISRMIVAMMSGSIFYTAYEVEDWGIVIRIVILFIAFLIYVGVK